MKNIPQRLAAALLLAAGPALADAQITVHRAQGQPTIQLGPMQNLSQLVTDPALQSEWPATAIAERGATAVAQRQQQQLLHDLRAWQADSSADLAATLGAVIHQLSAVQVIGRQFTSLDPDVVRLRPEANRTLSGQYDLYLVAAPETITVAGALTAPGKVRWEPGKTVRAYLADHTPLAGADRNIATVISPDGQLHEAPIAYWNQRHVEVDPGSLIWLGLDAGSLPWGKPDFNARMLSVLTHRIPD